MNKHLIILGMAVLLTCIGLSGCNEINLGGEKSTTLPDGTKVIGDIGQLEILDYEINEYKEIIWSYTQFSSQGSYFEFPPRTTEIPDYMDFSDINSNLTTRKNFCLNYVEPIANDTLSLSVDWNDDYWGWIRHYTDFDKGYRITRLSPNNDITKIIINGTAKNIGDDFLTYPKITVNYYNQNGSWLASATDYEDNIPSGYTWDFNISYTGEFVNDVSYISFRVDANQ